MTARRYIEEAIRTMAASRWTLLLARVFGKREWIVESGCVVTLVNWRANDICCRSIAKRRSNDE